jgi:hypothetical protein
MKSKFARLLGVGLTVAVLASLLVAAAPGSPASADVGTLRFDVIPLPKVGSAGNFVLTPNTDLGPIAVAPDGKVMFASANLTTSGFVGDILKSGDGGYTWAQQTGFRTAAAAVSDTTCIVDIKVSPQFATDGTVFVATEAGVYQSIDGGVSFTRIIAAASLTTDEESTPWVTNIDVTLDATGRLALLIGTATGDPYGNVWAYIPATTGLVYKAQWATSPGDVMAVAFSPKFASDGGIFCVVVDSTGNTTFRSSFGWTAQGGGWDTAIGKATFRDSSSTTGAGIAAWHARIAFPDDFTVGSLTSSIAFVGICAGSGEGTVNEKGDLYKVTLAPLTSAATDLNVRGSTGVLTPSATDIWTVAVTGNAAAASIMVGTDYWAIADYLGVSYFTAYYSNDSGVTWANAREMSPTGGATGAAGGSGYAINGIETSVVLAPDFATSKVAWAATCDDSSYQTSALSRTSNGGACWTQISLIDYADTTNYYQVAAISAVSPYSTTHTLWMMTKMYYAGLAGYYRYGSLWKTTNAGQNYERLFSYANPTASDWFYAFSRLSTNVFVYDTGSVSGANKFWRSSDATATSFPTVISGPYAGASGTTIRDANTIWLFSGGSIWSTTNGGLTWVKPTTSLVTSAPSSGFAFSGNDVIVAVNGAVYISTDGGANFASKLGLTDPGYSYVVGYDPGFATNKFVYCNVAATNGGIWRIAVDEAAPASTAWQRIDADPTYAPYSANVKPVVGFSLGIYYAFDYSPVATHAGGIWRSTNPTDDPNALYPPQWESFNTGLTAGTYFKYAGVSVLPNTLWGYNWGAGSSTTSPVWDTVAYYNQLVAMADTLSSGVTQDIPADKAKDIGLSTSTESLVMSVTLAWKAMTGATMYHYQIATDSAFVSKVVEESTSATTKEIVGVLLPGNTYYWRVRVGNYGGTTAGVTDGAPLISPWSKTFSFTTGVPYALQLKIIAPASGATGVPVQPTFVWTAVPNVTTYELVVSEDPTFAIIDWSRTSDKPQYTADEALAYSTVYNWRVRFTGGDWVYGVFTTEAEPTTPAPPITITTQPAPTITVVPGPSTEAVPSYLLWIIIAIGAILVIALIVLIVRTRRAG